MCEYVNVRLYQYLSLSVCDCANVQMYSYVNVHKRIYKLAVPGFEPESSGPQPLMLTTTLYHIQTNME